ncbi:initiation control protein YabA [Thermococcus argininiproducens]|uniref:Initiation control protein YabA n=1 Tax=Thermococcus argininiproducens TaxID=2866384 RepID=A0A9E7MAX9_9EURY|nr:initiation control protein YabA [Thermococcus argininiproducens]USH00289.1 initiation control protein YabA [Thermococcus argininiproducens]
MIKRILCKDLYQEIERLERSIIELEEEIIELKTQLNMKTEEATSLYIENQSLRHKIERLEKTHNQLIEMLKKMKIPFVVIDEDEFKDIEVDK